MLFVFGYRANKIRCKKISTLLHNSSDYPNATTCSVAIHFRQIVDKEGGTCEEVPDSEIIVERTAHRDNSSYYTINGKRVQFKEVAKLLKNYSVDLDHNRFLILQVNYCIHFQDLGQLKLASFYRVKLNRLL